VFTSRPTFSASNTAGVFLFMAFMFSPNIWMSLAWTRSLCSVQFQFFPIFLDPPDGIFYSKVEKQCKAKWTCIIMQKNVNKHSILLVLLPWKWPLVGWLTSIGFKVVLWLINIIVP
jgi:hypothetical protein